jgi:F-type H+-transporting ATPase subunit delta
VSEAQVARVYAQALFDAARAADAVERVGRELGDFVAALAASAPLRDALVNPRVEMAAKRRVVAELTDDVQPLLRNALQLVLQKGRASLLPEIGEEYAALAAREAGVVGIEVTSAVELSAEQLEKLASAAEQRLGTRVELARRVDPEIIGGLVLRVGDVIVDASLRARIRQLQRRLQTVEV